MQVGRGNVQVNFYYGLSRDISRLGAPKAARIMDRPDVAGYAEAYSLIHGELIAEQYRNARVHLQDLLVERAAAIARREKFDASEVRTLFHDGAPTVRVLALGLMQGDPSLADAPAITEAIRSPRSANEQYQGLKLAMQHWTRLTPATRAAVRSAIQASPEIQTGHGRKALAEKILAQPAS